MFGTLRHVFRNIDYTAGNTDIYIHDLAIDNTAGPTTGAHIHALGFYKVTRAGVYNITITSASGKLMDDGTAFVASNEYYVRNNKIYGTINACIDQWGGSSDFNISGNFCDGLGLANYGILVSGFNTDLTAATTQRGSIRGNVVNNFPGAGIWLQGGWNGVSGAGSTIGLVKKIEVVGNSVNTVANYHGIYLSDASNNVVTGNTFENIGRAAIIVTSENAGSSSGNVISDNNIVSCNAAAAAASCIQLTQYATNNTLANNVVTSAGQPYSLLVDAGATGNIIRGGYMAAGTISVLLDGGTNTQLQVGNTFNTVPTFATLTGYVKGNGASAATAASTIPTTDLSGLGTGVATALANATNSAGGVLVAPSALTANAIVVGGGTGPKTTLCSISTSPILSCSSTTAFTPQISVENKTNDGNGPYFIYQKQRNGAIVSANDVLGTFNFQGYDGSAYQTAAYFSGVVDSAVLGTVVGHIEFYAGGTNAFNFYKTYTQSLVPFKTPGVYITGSTPTITGSGTCTLGTQVGGPTTGKFTATAACVAGQTYTISGLTASANGWVCHMGDRTTAGVVFQQTGDSTTTAVMTVRTTNVANADVIQFECVGY